MALAGMTGRHCFPIHGFTDFQELYQSNHGAAGDCEAGSFVNSAVSRRIAGVGVRLLVAIIG